MKLYEKNSVHVCTDLNIKDLDSKLLKDKLHLDNGKQARKDLWRYTKGYEVDNTRYNLLIMVDRKSNKKVEKLLDSTAEDIARSNKLKSMVGNASWSPIDLGVK